MRGAPLLTALRRPAAIAARAVQAPLCERPAVVRAPWSQLAGWRQAARDEVHRLADRFADASRGPTVQELLVRPAGAACSAARHVADRRTAEGAGLAP